MKLGPGVDNFKSMGIPENMQEGIRKNQEKKNQSQRPSKEPVQSDMGFAQDEDDKTEKVEEQKSENKEQTPEEAAVVDPVKLLEKMGAKFDDESFAQILLKGYYETVVDIVPGRLKAKMRTLITKEYREIDEVCAEERTKTPMTHDGATARVSMWNISYGVLELNNKSIAKVEKNKTSLELAKARLDIFETMAPAIVNKIIKMHGQMTYAINMIVNDDNKEYLKNS